MEDLTVAYVVLGLGVVLLVLVVLTALPHVRRFTRANAALKADVTARGAALRTLMNSRRHSGE